MNRMKRKTAAARQALPLRRHDGCVCGRALPLLSTARPGRGPGAGRRFLGLLRSRVSSVRGDSQEEIDFR
jgi:hypothetical protein